MSWYPEADGNDYKWSVNKSVQHLSVIKINNEWETPQEFFNTACVDYHLWPKRDVCATAANTKCKTYFDEADDALHQNWREDFFMNPPYSNVKIWMQRAYTQHIRHSVNAMALIYVKTDTGWWHDFVEGKAEVHFIQGRVPFLLNGIRPRYCEKCKEMRIQTEIPCPVCNKSTKMNTSPYPSCWVIWRA